MTRPIVASKRTRVRAALAMTAVAVAMVACDGDGGPPAATPTGTAESGEEVLAGVFAIDAGKCGSEGVASGSYFRMVQPGGGVSKGPFVTNGDSPCKDKTWTPMSPGSDEGIVAGDYQANPEPAFDREGNGMADLIAQPKKWFAVEFSISTNPIDPQTKLEVPPVEIMHDGNGHLSGDIRALSAAWNGQYFNQGAPKPDGSTPGNTRPLTGTYDPSTGAYSIQWASQIVGGPFNNFTGIWRFEGTFKST